MSIVKRLPDNTGFTMVSNQVLQHETMSLVARGLLAHLLSLPAGSEIDATDKSFLGPFPETRACVNRAWRELQQLGYVQRVHRELGNKSAGYEWKIIQPTITQQRS